MCELMDFYLEIVFVCLGGNDISVNFSLWLIFEDIVNVVFIFFENGYKNVYISEIIIRG